MANGFSSASSSKKISVRQYFLKKKLIEAKKYYFLKDFSKAESLFLYLKNSKYENSEALEYLANIYIQKYDYKKAINTLEDAITLFPRESNLYFNLGTIYFNQREYQLSVNSYLNGIKVDPSNAYAYSNLAGIYEEMSDYKNAVMNYKRAFSLKNDLLQVKEKLITLQPKICDWSFYEYFEGWREDFIYNSQFEGEPLSLLSFEGDPYKEYLLAKKYYDLNFKSNKKINFTNQNKKIKVGYLSADFNNHPVAILLSRIIELHDKDKFEIIGYSLSNEKDEMTKRLKKSFDNFVDLTDLSDSECINLIRKDKLDIAIDLMGYTKNARFNLFAERIAPKQISFLGYPGTVGGDAIDYIIADKKIIPKNFSKFYSEKVLYMPKTFMPFDNTIEIKKLDITKQTYGLPCDKFVLAAFHRIEKINPKVLDLWSEILMKLDNCVLWVKDPSNPFVKKNLIWEFKKRGVSEEKIYFAERTQTLSEHLSRHKLADLFLDTFYYSSHSTAILSLWAGLPIVTLKGRNFASRVVPSLLENLSMHKLIASNATEYFKIILDLYKDKNNLKKLKDNLEIEKVRNKIFNSKFFTRELEKLFFSI